MCQANLFPTTAYLWHNASKIWNCEEPEFRLCLMKLFSSDNTKIRLHSTRNSRNIFCRQRIFLIIWFHYQKLIKSLETRILCEIYVRVVKYVKYIYIRYNIYIYIYIQIYIYIYTIYTNIYIYNIYIYIYTNIWYSKLKNIFKIFWHDALFS